MTAYGLLNAALCSHDAFLVRAVRYLAGQVGVRQFMDLGAGIADGPMFHTVAQQIIPTARVLYVTDDPILLAHANDGPASPGSVDWLEADLTDPAPVVEYAEATLDLTEPVAVWLTGILHVLGETDADGIVACLVDAIATESHVVVSHLACDLHPAEVAAVQRQFTETTPETWTFRNRDHVRSFFAGLDLVDPGVVQVDDWRPAMSPNPPPVGDGQPSPMWVGVGRRP